MPRSAVRFLRLLACFLCLAGPSVSAPAGPSSILAYAAAAPAAQDKEEERSCRRGRDTKEFGWKVVDFGMATLKYLVGLLIIPIGLLLVVIGAALQAIEWVAC